MNQYIIRINGGNTLVNKKDTPKNLKAVAEGRKWGGVYCSVVKSKNCLFELGEARKMVEILNTYNGKLGGAFTTNSFSYTIENA